MPKSDVRANHCKSSATFRQGTLRAGSKNAKVNGSVHVGALLCFCLCRVFVCPSACTCACNCVCAQLPTRVRWLFAVLACSPETLKSWTCNGDGDVLSNMFICISMLRNIGHAHRNIHTHTHARTHARTNEHTRRHARKSYMFARDVQQKHEQLALLNTRTRR